MQYVPTSEAEVKSRIKDFIKYIPSLQTAASLRNSFDDIEVNEGRWLMEGTANFLKNINIPDHKQDHFKTYSFNIPNLLDNNSSCI